MTVPIKRSPGLAVLGATPAFPDALHVGRPNLCDRERLMGRIADILDRRWFTNNGFYVQELERQIAKMLGVRHCVAVCNGTIALEILIRAAGLDGEVIVPSFTFVATAHALQWQQVRPVFCDIDASTHLLDPAAVAAAVTPRTAGIIGVHTWGNPQNAEALEALARERHLALIFDAAHAFACGHRGRSVGGFGDAEVFSFHATKFFNTFEGGAITTNDDALAARSRLMRNFGFAGLDNVTHVGTNGKMTEVCAAMGVTGLEELDRYVEVNRRNHGRYRQGLESVPGIRLLAHDPLERRNFQYVVLEIDETEAGLSRDQVLEVLCAENVMARRYFYPGCHRMEPYRTLYPDAGRHLPHTEAVCGRVLILPTGTAMSETDVDRVCELIRIALQERDGVLRALGHGGGA
jgi:dTDP-4-amino-4,6-dideoxygalactose transaminase